MLTHSRYRKLHPNKITGNTFNFVERFLSFANKTAKLECPRIGQGIFTVARWGVSFDSDPSCVIVSHLFIRQQSVSRAAAASLGNRDMLSCCPGVFTGHWLCFTYVNPIPDMHSVVWMSPGRVNTYNLAYSLLQVTPLMSAWRRLQSVDSQFSCLKCGAPILTSALFQ